MSAPVRIPDLDPRFVAAVDLIGRTGASGFQFRDPDPDVDLAPLVWVAVATYPDGRADAAAATHPVGAVLRLCERLVDGGRCAHCGNPTSFYPDLVESTPMEDALGVCVFMFDPELRTYRRGCEGSHP